MKKYNYKLLYYILIFIFTMSMNSCNYEEYPDYKSTFGYNEYINDSNKGYSDTPYYNVYDSMNTSKEAREYFRVNSRRVGDYLITDYENGVCINRYFGWHSSGEDLEIPQTIDNRPVIKIGGYIDKKNISNMNESIIGAFGGYSIDFLKIPSTLKVISSDAILQSTGIIDDTDNQQYVGIFGFDVDNGNPYYSSKNGTLYTNDYDNLLWVNTSGYSDDNSEWNNNEYTVPNFVKVFEPSNGVDSSLNKITFGKNIKEIKTYINKGEDGVETDTNALHGVVICGYKDSVAEKWAKEQYAKFEAISK